MMASFTSTPARRAVLGELNVNSPIGIPSSSDTRKHTSGAEKPSSLGETISLQKSIKEHYMVDTVHGEAGLVGTKRRDNGLVEALQRSAKKLKTEVGHGARDILVRGVSGILRGPDGGSVSDEIMHSRSSLTPVRSHVGSAQTSSPVSVSPGSSSGFSETALNDTQITEPDEARVVPVLTQAELRERARAIKLRLRLASYKVRTNQVNLPMSRLQIKTTRCSFQRLPTSRTRVNQPQHRTPLPSAASSIPNIQLQKPSAEKQRQTDIISSSPPPMLRAGSPPAKKKFESASPSKEGEEETREECATPLLPRHRQGLLNPPNLGSPTRDELTSSVVKRGTADVLLSLKLQR